jgi:dihydrofolate reductase
MTSLRAAGHCYQHVLDDEWGGLMRKVILKMHVSLDGFVATPSGDLDFIFRDFDDDLTAWEGEGLRRAGLHIMGRVTYNDMAAHWPTSTEPFAPPMNEIPKVVFSTTLEETGWQGSRVVDRDLAEEIPRLKEQGGKDILAHGGASFAQSLSRLRLIDEYQLVVHPVVLGAGLPLFSDALELKLLDATTFDSGVLASTYARATSSRFALG